MMKWIILAGTVVLMAGCCCTTPSAVVYSPVVTYKPVVAYKRVSPCGAVMTCAPVAVSPVVQPVMIQPYNDGPWDVTTTTIDFY